MKINHDFILKEIAGTPVVMPVGEAANRIHGMIHLNETSALIWNAVEAGKSRDQILEQLKAEYNAPQEKLSADLDAFLKKLRDNGILED